MDYPSYDLEQLKTLYAKAEQALNEALLDGASWNEVAEKRLIVTTLAIHIHQKNKQVRGSLSPGQ